MCLAVPARIVELLPDAQALVDLDGVRREISVALVDGLAPGDYVVLHVGFALARLDPDEARRTLELFAQAGIIGARGEGGERDEGGDERSGDGARGAGGDALR